MADTLITLAERAAARIVAATRKVEAQARDLVVPAPSHAPLEDNDSLEFYNASGEVIPQYGIIHLRPMEYPTYRLYGYKPAYRGLGNIAIACQAIPADIVGRAWFRGCHSFQSREWWNNFQYQGVRSNERIGAKEDSWWPVHDPIGPITWLYQSVSRSVYAPYLVHVKMTGERGSPILVNWQESGGFLPAPCYTLIVCPPYTASFTEDGTVTIS